MSFTKKRLIRYQSEGDALRIRPVFQDFHLLTVQKPGDYPLHQHTNYELIVVSDGPYCCTLNHQEIERQHGEFLLIKPGDWHQDHFQPGQRHYVLHFLLSQSDFQNTRQLPLFDPRISPMLQCGTTPLENAENFFAGLERELNLGDRFTRYLQDAMLETFFWQLIRLLPEEGLSRSMREASHRERFLEDLHALFDANCRAGLQLEEMAAELGMSTRTLAYRCRELLGQTPAKAFAVFRINRAAERLQSTRLTIQQVAYEYGFQNPYHFSRLFKSIKGSSPLNYRSR